MSWECFRISAAATVKLTPTQCTVQLTAAAARADRQALTCRLPLSFHEFFVGFRFTKSGAKFKKTAALAGRIPQLQRVETGGRRSFCGKAPSAAPPLTPEYFVGSSVHTLSFFGALLRREAPIGGVSSSRPLHSDPKCQKSAKNERMFDKAMFCF